MSKRSGSFVLVIGCAALLVACGSSSSGATDDGSQNPTEGTGGNAGTGASGASNGGSSNGGTSSGGSANGGSAHGGSSTGGSSNGGSSTAGSTSSPGAGGSTPGAGGATPGAGGNQPSTGGNAGTSDNAGGSGGSTAGTGDTAGSGGDTGTSGAGGGTGTPGACTNANDMMVSSASTFSKAVDDCGNSCLGKAACVATCLEKTGLSDACSNCWGAQTNCGATKCLTQCIGGDSPGCEACTTQMCEPAFDACAGTN